MNRGIVVVGGGGWGTALAGLVAKRGSRVGLWCREPEVAEEIDTTRMNSHFLPGVRVPPEVEIFTDLTLAAGAEVIFLAVPVQHLREVSTCLAPFVRADAILVNCAKGLEIGSGLRPSQILHATLGRGKPIITLSGPSHAEEVGRDLPTAVVVAGTRTGYNRAIQQLLNSAVFRVYTTTDQIGVEIAGALKNVIALAAGIAEGLGFGDNARAALATRGLSEITHLGEAMGADARTFSGLAGMGDLFATLASEYSRNRRAGREIGRGHAAAEVLAASRMAIEGIPTCRAALILAERYRMEMPITECMGSVLFAGQDPREAVAYLMSRAPIPERVAWYTRWRGRHEKEKGPGSQASVRRRYRRHRERMRAPQGRP